MKSDFLTELKRRGVFRVAAGYVAGAFFLLQAADLAVIPLRMPQWTMTALWIIVLTGFPVALALSWAFEVTSSGIVHDGAVPPSSSAAPSSSPSEGRVFRGPLVFRAAVAVCFIVLAASTGFVMFKHARDGPIDSIGVLAFMDMSPSKDQGYFSDGVAEQLLDGLSGVEGLRVASRTASFAFKGKDTDPDEIARRLNVRALLTGSVRKDEKTVRISVELIDPASGYNIWSRTFDHSLDNILALQDQISRQVLAELRIKLRGGDHTPVVREATHSGAAYDRYLLAKQYAVLGKNEEQIRLAIDLYQQAIAADSTYAIAYAGLSRAYWLLGDFEPAGRIMPLAEAAARKAVQIDSTDSDAQIALANVVWRANWDWAGADSIFRKAVLRDPRSLAAQRAYGGFLFASRRFREGLVVEAAADRLQTEHATDTVANALSMRTDNARRSLAMRHYAAALAEAQKILTEDSAAPGARWVAALSLLGLGRATEAVPEIERVVAEANGRQALRAHLGYAYGLAGRTRDAERILAEFLERSKHSYVPKDQIAAIYMGLGRSKEAFEMLEKAADEQHWYLVQLNNSVVFVGMRKDPAFMRFLRRIHAPDGDL